MQEIVDFNKKWTPDFDYLAYIARIEGVARSGGLAHGPGVTVALTPDALVYYLQEVCGFSTARWLPGDQGGDGILGLCSTTETGGSVDRLKHWVYRHGGTVYNWGRTESNFAGLLTRRSWRVDIHVLPTR